MDMSQVYNYSDMFYRTPDGKFVPVDMSAKQPDSVFNTKPCPIPMYPNQEDTSVENFVDYETVESGSSSSKSVFNEPTLVLPKYSDTEDTSVNDFVRYESDCYGWGPDFSDEDSTTTSNSGETISLTTRDERAQLTPTGQAIVDANETAILNDINKKNTKAEIDELKAEDEDVEEAAETIIENSNNSSIGLKALLGKNSTESIDAYNELSADQQKAVKELVKEETGESVRKNVKEQQSKEVLGSTAKGIAGGIIAGGAAALAFSCAPLALAGIAIGGAAGLYAGLTKKPESELETKKETETTETESEE